MRNFFQSYDLALRLGAFRVLALGLLINCAIGQLPASAQYNSHRSNQNSLGGLLETIVKAGQQSSAKKAWQALPSAMQDCMYRGLSTRSLSMQALINQGVSPTDPRLSSLTTRCEALTTRELQTDLECTIPIVGVPTATRCNEAYAVETGRMTRVISRDQYILLGIRGEPVSIAQTETPEAMRSRSEREAAEQAAADAVARAQQMTAESAARKRAEADRREKAEVDAALRKSLEERDRVILSGRTKCSAQKAAGSFARLLSDNNDHKVAALLLNTNASPVEAYQAVVAWLPNATDKAPLFGSLRDRIDYDAKQWSQTISRSGGGNYSWDSLKRALDTLGGACLWRQHDQLALGVARALSPNAKRIATRELQASSASDRIAESIMGRIPSNQFLN